MVLTVKYYFFIAFSNCDCQHQKYKIRFKKVSCNDFKI